MTLAPRILPILLLAAGPGCDSARPQELDRDQIPAMLVGCYELRDGAGLLIDSTYYGTSPRVQLFPDPVGVTEADTLPGVVWAAARLDTNGERTDDIDSRRQFGPTWWADSLADSVHLSFVNGFSGAVFTLAFSPGAGDTLQGRVEEHWDLGPTVTPRGAALAVRVPCL